MAIRIYNTLTGKKEDFTPIKEGKVGMYVCGPTVYDAPHIGHARSAYIFDFIRRYFIYRGYKVKFVRNVTDVDDKIINKAKEDFKEEEITKAVNKVSDKYLKAYHQYMDILGIERPDKEPKASAYIDKMHTFISLLIERGAAYGSGGDVYFDVKKAKGYGKLSNQKFEKLESGARIAPDENKKSPLDFALWKRAKEGEVSWDSPWGRGRPGWHIECSVMSIDILGDQFDIHGGGIDLVFPHHENELAQSEGAGKKIANYWIHNGLLTINKEKMAKSLGNFISIEDILNKYDPDALKVLFLQAHYSHPVDFSWDKMDVAKKAYDRFYILFDKISRDKGLGTSRFASGHGRQGAGKGQDFFRKKFEEVMDDDFNTPEALAVLFEMVTHINKSANTIDLQYAEDTLIELGNVLGLFGGTRNPDKNITISKKEEIEKLVEDRDKARKGKDFKRADEIRERLDSLGVILGDQKGGTAWRIK